MICNEICDKFTDRVISWALVAGAKDNKKEQNYLRSREQLVHEYSEWPEVYRPVVALEWTNQTPVFMSRDLSWPIRG